MIRRFWHINGEQNIFCTYNSQGKLNRSRQSYLVYRIRWEFIIMGLQIAICFLEDKRLSILIGTSIERRKSSIRDCIYFLSIWDQRI